MSSSLPAKLELNFQLTPRDIYKANVAVTGQVLGRLRIILMIVMTLVGGSALFIIVGRGLGQHVPLGEGATWGILFTPLFFLYLFYGAPYFNAKSQYKNSENLRNTIRYSISDDLVTLQSATARSEMRWTTFLKAQETADLFLLYVRKGIAHPIPKRAFTSAEELSEFRELLRRHVKTVSFRTRS